MSNTDIQGFVKFFKQAKHNNERWYVVATGYEKDRIKALIDWCDFLLGRLAEENPETFEYGKFREKYGYFEYHRREQ